jgi:arylformamidase
MIRKGLIGLIIAAMLSAPLAAQSLRERIRERIGRQVSAQAPAPAAGGEVIAYGNDPLQTLRYWQAPKTGAPLVLFVHGGGWSRGDKDNATGALKVTHLRAQGYAFASLNYRLVPTARVEDQAADIAAALRHLIDRAGTLGFDPSRIVLMGHSAGAHLVALVGTDPAYFKASGMSVDALRGIVPIDGAAYDVPAQMEGGSGMMKQTYVSAFGTDPNRQRALSPIYHANTPNAPAFLILHVQRKDGAAQSRSLGDALRKAGTAVQINSIAGEGLRGHMEINRRLGDPEYAATPVLDAWLKAQFGR